MAGWSWLREVQLWLVLRKIPNCPNQSPFSDSGDDLRRISRRIRSHKRPATMYYLPCPEGLKASPAPPTSEINSLFSRVRSDQTRPNVSEEEKKSLHILTSAPSTPATCVVGDHEFTAWYTSTRTELYVSQEKKLQWSSNAISDIIIPPPAFSKNDLFHL